MGLKTICKLSDQSDVVIKRSGWCNYSMEVKRFSIYGDEVRPNAWPKNYNDHYDHLSWTDVRYLILDACAFGLRVPDHCIEHFKFQTKWGRVCCFFRNLLH